MKKLSAALAVFFLFQSTVVLAETNIAKIAAGKISRERQIRHLLNRMAFGPKIGEVEELLKTPNGMENWIQAQLHPETIDDSETDKKIAKLPILKMSPLELSEKFKNQAKIIKQEGLTQAQIDKIDKAEFREEHSEQLPKNLIFQQSLQKIIRAAESKREFQEVMVDFWFNHFNVDMHKGKVKWFAISYERDAIRPHVFGKFKDLLSATAHHPAMLFYLDNWQSVKNGFVPPNAGKKAIDADLLAKTPKGINENYARELMELHTLGVDGGYTQADIIEVAKAFTGWTIDRLNKDAAFLFRPRPHDETEVTILGKKFNGKDGVKEGEAVLEFLAAQPATAKFLAGKLCNRFVQEPAPKSCIDLLAKKYLETDGDLRAIYQTLFSSKDFWDEKSIQQKVKRPFDFLASALRAVGAEVDPGQDIDDKNLVKLMQGLGQPLYHCVPPTGYREDSAEWVNTGALVARLRAAQALASGRWESVRWDWKKIFPEAEGDAALDIVAERLIGQKLRTETRQTIERLLTGNELGIHDRELRNGEQIRVLALLLGSPEFQRR